MKTCKNCGDNLEDYFYTNETYAEFLIYSEEFCCKECEVEYEAELDKREEHEYDF